MLRPLSKRKQNDAYLIAHAAIRKDPFVLLPFLTQSLSNTLTGESYFCTYINIVLDIESFQICYVVNSVYIRPWGFSVLFLPCIH